MVEELMRQLEKAHDDYTKLKQTYANFEEALKEKDDLIQHLNLEYEKCQDLIKSERKETEEMKAKME